MLDIGLLGDFRLMQGGEPVGRVVTPRLQALMAYLILSRGTPQQRRYLAFSFWPDSTEQQALTNLRHVLHDLRRALPGSDQYLRAERKTLSWNLAAPYTLDLADFEEALAGAEDAICQGDGVAARETLERASELYRGDLLPSCYDAWIEPERERLRQAHLRALMRLVDLLEERRDYATAIYYARRLVQAEPLREATFEVLMRLHALDQDRAGALKAYEACSAMLRHELDIAPGPAVQALYERLKAAQPLPVERAAAQPARQHETQPLVGRRAEWKQLRAAWQETACGHAHLAVVTGEAGIGKTRLVGELFAWAGRQGITTAQSRSYAAEGRLAYAPVADWLRTGALAATLPGLGPVWMGEVSRLLPELRQTHPHVREPAPLRENWQRLRLFEALARAVLAPASPLLLVLDDMQWTDAETLAWLRYLLRFAPEAPLLVAGTIRTEEMDAEPALAALLADLRRDGVVTELMLGPLGASETAEIAAHVAGRALDDAQAELLHAETEGNPLFIVERVRAGLLDAAASGASLPPKVRAVIASRLGQLSEPARNVTALAATIGRAFSLDVLTAAADRDEEHLVAALDELWQRHIIREHDAGTYYFTHEKLREGAYAELSPVRRRSLHRRVALALERVHAGALDAVSGRLAAHYEQAGLLEPAIRYARRSGQLARDVHANEEAIRLFRKALALLGRLPATPERDEQELALQTALGACMVASRGHGATEVKRVYERARVLCERLGRPTEPPILRALSNLNLSAGHLRQAYALGEEILQQAGQNPVLLTEGSYVLGVSSFWLGTFTRARHHLEEAIHHYDPQQHGVHIALYAQDPKVICLCRLGRTLWYLGYPDQGAQKVEDSLRLARMLGHPHSLAYALWAAGGFYFDLGDLRKARAHVDRLIPLAAGQGFSLFASSAGVLQGGLLAEEKDEAGLASIRRGLRDWTDAGGSLSVSQYYGYLADACLKTGTAEGGLAALAEGFALVETTEEQFYEAELFRLKGELLLARGAAADAAAACFRQALEVARLQEARSLELRAAMSLGRLQHSRGAAEEAHHRLQYVYDWFSEGFDTPDLKAAAALLDAWS